MGRIRRALKLCASLLACLTLAVLGSRWQATRALDAARARTEALGLRLDTDTRESPRAPEVEAAITEALVQHVCRAASVAVEAGDSAGAWRQLEAAAEVCMTLRDTDLHSFPLLGGGLRRLKSSFEEAVAADASDPARARIRATLGELDVARIALTALRATGAANLHAAETRPELARVHSTVQRAMGHHWRDRAELHHGWADIVEVSERAPPGERGAALKAICARPWAAAGHHTVSARLLPDASILWQYVAANEADLAVLLAE
jgi:hypothetical protein